MSSFFEILHFRLKLRTKSAEAVASSLVVCSRKQRKSGLFFASVVF